jgi:N-acetylmuramoyl-L-alanine amidase
MTITPAHWLDPVKRTPIPGGAVMAIRRFLVIHFTAGASAESSINWWRKPAARGTSAHIVIDRDGTVFQCRPFNRTAAHAGSSRWTCPNSGKTFFGLNACTIGIELANGGHSYPTRFSDLPPTIGRHKNGGPELRWETYPEKQIQSLIDISRVIVGRYNLDDIVGHDDIAPTRKTDPGPAFPMARVRTALGFPATYGPTA